MPPVIQLENISKAFAERTWKSVLLRKTRHVQALQDVSLSVQGGEVLGLLGPNGAGKTTLIKILATLVSPDSGFGTIAGFDLQQQAHHIRHHIGLVSTNDRTFYWRLSGRDNLSFFASLYNIVGMDRKQRINEVLELVNLSDKADFRFMSYSAGQRQRLAIARGLLANPEILLLDEATSSLDPIAARKMIEFTRSVLVRKQKKTIIWCTHNLKEAEDICDRLAILHNGRILQSGAIHAVKQVFGRDELYQFTVSSFVPVLVESPGFMELGLAEDGVCSCTVVLDRNSVPTVIDALAAAGSKVYECKKIDRPLSDIFTKLINRENNIV